MVSRLEHGGKFLPQRGVGAGGKNGGGGRLGTGSHRGWGDQERERRTFGGFIWT